LTSQAEFPWVLTPARICSTEWSVRCRRFAGCGVGWIVVLLCGLFLGCGGDDLEFGTSKKNGNLSFGKGESSLHFGAQGGGGRSGSRKVEDTTVRGNIFNLRPATSRPIVVFVFVNLRDSGTFQDFDDAEVATITTDRSFLVSHLAAGDLTVVFLLDQVGVNQDGTIDPGDPIAIFHDPKGRLHNLSADTDVTLEDVDLTFNLSAPDSGTATVQSEANLVVQQQSTAETPTADPTSGSPTVHNP
jgi:hypothetical protein